MKLNTVHHDKSASSQDINSTVFTYFHGDNEKTRYQIINIKRNNGVYPVDIRFDSQVLTDLSRLSRIHLLPKMPEIGSLCLFCIQTNLSDNLPELFNSREIIDPSARIRYILNKSAEDGSTRVENGTIVSSISDVTILLNKLNERNLLSLIEVSSNGNLLFIPVSDRMGYLSNHFEESRVVFNSHFFLMDLTDLETHFDLMGESYGLLMLDGKIISPPLYPRSALFIGKNGKSRIKVLSIKDIGIVIDNDIYYHGKNCTVMIRPETRVSPFSRGIDIAVVGGRIVGFTKNGGLDIPEAGYVINLPLGESPGSLKVEYVPLEGSLGIQVGPPLIGNNILHTEFKQPFYNGSGIKYPPTVYPQGWTTGRAARLGLGTTQDEQLSLIWVEGSKPLMYRPGVDSKGVTLSEFAEIGKNHRLKEFINLDGGGSSQVSVNADRILSIADKRNEKGDEFERPVPKGLGIRI